MAIEQKTHLYEVLVRLNENGFVGGHAIDLERLVDGEQTIAEKTLAPRPLTQAEVGTLLGGEVAALIEQLDGERADKQALIAEQEAALGALRDEHAAEISARNEAHEAALAELRGQLGATAAVLVERDQAIAAADATSAAQAAQIAELEAETARLQELLNPPPATDPKSLIEARMEAVFEAGYTPTSGPLAGHTLQVRDVVDRTNWLTSQVAYAAAIAGGYGDVIDASFRTAANETVTISYLDGYQALLGMAAWGKAVMARSWALKDALAAGTLDEADIATGWPGDA